MGQNGYDLKPFGWPAPGVAPVAPQYPAPVNPFGMPGMSDRIRALKWQREQEEKRAGMWADGLTDFENQYEDQQNADMHERLAAAVDQIQMPEPPVVMTDEPGTTPAQRSQNEIEGLWARSGMESDANALDRSIQEGHEREAEDQAAWDDSFRHIGESTSIHSPEVSAPDEMSEQARIGAKVAADAQAAMADDAARVRAVPGEIKPLPTNAKPPAQGFGGRDSRVDAANQRQKNTRRAQRGPGWSDAAEAPLPGEETLPPQIAAWNQERTSKGVHGGMAQLKAAYDIAQNNIPTGHSFEEWLATKGLTEATPPNEAKAILDKVLMENQIEFPNHDPLAEGLGDDPRINKRDDSILMGRAGVADNTPLDSMTEKQRRMIGTHRDGIPRTARGGEYIWDAAANGGQGGYVRRGFDLNAARNARTIQEKASALGIDFTAYGDNIPQLEQDVAKVMADAEVQARHNDVVAVPGGGSRLTPNAQSIARADAKRAEDFTLNMAKRFAKELKDRGIPVTQVKAYYLEGLAQARKNGSANPYAEAAGYVNSVMLNDLRSQRAQTIRLARTQRTDQYNRSIDFGVPTSVIRGLDTINAAEDPRTQYRALLGMHAIMPGMGFDKMAAMLMKGQIEGEQLRTWAASFGNKPKGIEAYNANVQEVQNTPVGMDTFAKANAIAAQAAGPNATPDQIKAARQSITRPVIQKLVKQDTLTNHDLTLIRQDTEGMTAKQFYEYAGLDANDQRSWAVYEQVFKKPARGPWQQGTSWVYNHTVGPQGLDIFGEASGNAAQAQPPAPPAKDNKPDPKKPRRPF